MLTFDERGKLLSEAIKRGDTPVEINCTGVALDKIRSVRKVISAEIFNEKIMHWQKVELTEHLETCPICGKLMKVIAVIGTTWVAACCEDHTMQVIKELEKGWHDRNNIDMKKEYDKKQDNKKEKVIA